MRVTGVLAVTYISNMDYDGIELTTNPFLRYDSSPLELNFFVSIFDMCGASAPRPPIINDFIIRGVYSLKSDNLSSVREFVPPCYVACGRDKAFVCHDV